MYTYSKILKTKKHPDIQNLRKIYKYFTFHASMQILTIHYDIFPTKRKDVQLTSENLNHLNTESYQNPAKFNAN